MKTTQTRTEATLRSSKGLRHHHSCLAETHRRRSGKALWWKKGGGLQVGSRCEALGLGKLEAAPWRPSIPCDVTVDGLASWVGHGWGQGSEFHCHLALVCLYVQSLTLFRATSVHSVAKSTQALKKQGAPGQVSAMV